MLYESDSSQGLCLRHLLEMTLSKTLGFFFFITVVLRQAC